MGRYINCQIGDDWEIVWKYGFGVQNSEMSRICTELGIGEYHLIRYSEDEDESEYEYISEDVIDGDDIDGDILILTRSDIDKLGQQIERLQQAEDAEQNKWFIGMLEAIRNFMVEHSEQNKFVFEGEF